MCDGRLGIAMLIISILMYFLAEEVSTSVQQKALVALALPYFTVIHVWATEMIQLT